MKNLYLRIGSDKAGTVSLERLVRENKALFSRYSILAPTENCTALFDVISNKCGAYDIGNFKDKSEKRSLGVKSILDKLDQGERIDENIFLTTETLWGRLSKRDLDPVRNNVVRFLGSIRETFPDHKIKIILHLRRIALYLESLYKQEVKAGRLVKLDKLKSRLLAKRAFSFFKILEDVFGSDNIIVRPFERSQLHNGCVVKDMLSTLGLSEHVDEFEISHGNEGLHRDLMETLIRMNQRYGKITSNGKLLKISSRLGTEFGYQDVKHILGLQARQELLEQYEEFYCYLSDNYGDGKSFFKESLPDDSHLGYKLDPQREALIEKLVLEQRDTPDVEVAKT